MKKTRPTIKNGIHHSSFRDPSGFIFFRDGILYRQVNLEYSENYETLIQSGLYEKLISKNLLIPHVDCDICPEKPETSYRIIKPLKIPFISYPYEWCFSQLKQAALLTLKIERISLKMGMTLKDASAYNIQFFEGKPIFIDTLSFEIYEEGKPWEGYLQFCQHFLAPLLLMQYRDIRLGKLLCSFIDGVPLDLTSSLLPLKTWMNFGILMHIHLHAKSEKKYAHICSPVKMGRVRFNSVLGLMDNLSSTIDRINRQEKKTQWSDYYRDTNYSNDAFCHKKEIITSFIAEVDPHSLWDLGANNGLFSRIASDKGIITIAFDNDPECVEANYREIFQNDERHILSLHLDIANPSPGIGWQNKERESLKDRGSADMALCLALIHHLVITNNIPLERIVEFLSEICDYLAIEFIPKNDSQIQKLLIHRKDSFEEYNEDHFEKSLSEYFKILNKVPIRSSGRILYLMKKR
jgi:ribosomal protein L11 methylase PrmA